MAGRGPDEGMVAGAVKGTVDTDGVASGHGCR